MPPIFNLSVDVYNGYILNYEKVYFENFIKSKRANDRLKSSGFVNGKLQHNLLYLSSTNSKENNWGSWPFGSWPWAKHTLGENSNLNVYSCHIYQSPKYERYQSVFCRIFSFTNYYGGNQIQNTQATAHDLDIKNAQSLYSTSPQALTAVHIYNRNVISGNNPAEIYMPAYNPEQLDVYYDTIYTLNEYKYYQTMNPNDEMFYNKFGDDILPLVLLPISVPFDSDKKLNSTIDIGDIYAKPSNTLQTKRFSVDRPEDSVSQAVVTEEQDLLKYSFYRYFNNTDSISTTLSGCNFYNSLKTIYNYIDNQTIRDLMSYNIFTINDEYSIIAGKYYLAISSYNLWATDFKENISLDKINYDQSFKLDSIVNNKPIFFEEDETISYETVLGKEFTDLINELYRIKENKISINECGIETGERELNIEELNNVNTILMELDAKKTLLHVQSNANDLASININFDNSKNNKLNVACFTFYKAVIFVRPIESYFNFPVIEISKYQTQGSDGKINIPYGLHFSDINKVYAISGGQVFKFNFTSHEPVINQHSGEFTTRKLLDTTADVVYNFISPLTEHELNAITGYTRFADFNYQVTATSYLNNIAVENSFLEENRFIICGVAINISTTNSYYIRFITSVNALKSYVASGYVKVEPFPVPMFIDANGWNVGTTNTIAQINNNFNLDVSHDLITDSTNIFNITAYKNSISSFVNGESSGLSAYDISSYNAYNQNSFKQNYSQLRSIDLNRMDYIYMIYDKYTNTFDLISTKDLRNSAYHKGKISFSRQIANVYRKTDFHENNPIEASINFTNTISCSNTLGSEFIFFKELRIINYEIIFSKIDSVQLNYKVYNKSSTTYLNKTVILDEDDFIISGNDRYIDLTLLNSADEIIVGNLKYTFYMNVPYRLFTYSDSFSIKVSTNFLDFSNVLPVISQAAYFQQSGQQQSSVTELYCNIFNNKFENILPQVIYNKNISLSIFDINDDIWEFLPDNKLCSIFNHYIGNDNSIKTLTDVTNYDTTDVAIIDKFFTDFNVNNDQTKVLPALITPNLNKYIKVWMKLELPVLLEDLIETFEYNNLYNISLKDSTKGVLILDGKITDATDIDNFENLLKEYKINLIFTASHNVNNTITIPINATIIYEIFDTYSNYTNNIPSFIYPTREETILMEIRNRGEFIESSLDYNPKLLEYIEYYDIYPEYEQQEEVLHHKTLEFRLTSIDSSTIKVSELYFDIYFATDDTFVGIPVNYKDSTTPEDELVNIVWSNDKYEILNYINWLIRFKCPNCGDAHYKLRIITRPKYFGFNIQSLNIGCYSHNIKLEQFIPYMFFKESANTVLLLDKDTSIEKEKMPVLKTDQDNFQDSTNNQTNVLVRYQNDVYDETFDKDTIISHVDKPINTRISCVIFNSSYNNKKVFFEMTNNNSSKTIHNSYQEFTLTPLEFRLISLIEPVDTTDYVDVFDSGFVDYNLMEYDYKSDSTTLIERVKLAIPSMDDFLRGVMNFFDKTAKLITLDYEKNIFKTEMGNQSSLYRKTDNTTIKVITTKSSILQFDHIDGLKDIDYIFYINETYDVIVDRSILSSLFSWLQPLGETFYIKVPFIFDRMYMPTIDISGIAIHDHKQLSDETATVEINNLFNSDVNYLYLVGNQTNVDQFTFKLNGIIKLVNSTILTQILDDDEIDKSNFSSLGVNIQLRTVDPEALLRAFFQDNGIGIANETVNNFFGSAELPENPINVVTSLLQNTAYFASTHRKTGFINYYYISGKSNVIKLPPIIYESVNKIIDVGNMQIYNVDLNRVIPNSYPLFIPEHVKKDAFSESIGKFYSIYNQENEITGNYMDIDLDDQVFDDVLQSLENSLINDVFNSTGLYKCEFMLLTSIGIKRAHYFSIKCDATYDAIIGAKISDAPSFILKIPDKEYVENLDNINQYEIKYTGDNKVTLYENNNYLNIDFINFRQSNLDIVIDDKKFSATNRPYSMFKGLQKKILQEPMVAFTPDFNKFPIKIIIDTNYKMIFEIPIEIFKATQSYITIDKIRIADNFINPTDYCLIFGDLNERFNIKGNEYVFIGKTYDKYDKESIRILLRGFNICNQSGEFYSSILIYYTFNGEQFVIKKDIKYVAELPNVLDNEYLIATVTRLDNSIQPTELYVNGKGETFTAERGIGYNEETKRLVLNQEWGTAGCDLSYPDFNWFELPL